MKQLVQKGNIFGILHGMEYSLCNCVAAVNVIV